MATSSPQQQQQQQPLVFVCFRSIVKILLRCCCFVCLTTVVFLLYCVESIDKLVYYYVVVRSGCLFVCPVGLVAACLVLVPLWLCLFVGLFTTLLHYIVANARVWWRFAFLLLHTVSCFHHIHLFCASWCLFALTHTHTHTQTVTHSHRKHFVSTTFAIEACLPCGALTPMAIAV